MSGSPDMETLSENCSPLLSLNEPQKFGHPQLSPVYYNIVPLKRKPDLCVCPVSVFR